MENNEDFIKVLNELSVNYANRKYMSILNGFFINSNELMIANYLIAAFKQIDTIDEIRKKQLFTLYTILML